MSDSPLIDIAEQREAEQAAAAAEARAEIHQRITLVEDALEAMHIGIDTISGRVMRLIAKVAGYAALRRTMTDLAEDPDVEASRERVAAVVDMLVDEGLLEHSVEPEPPFRRRGRPPKMHRLAINWDQVRHVRRWESERFEMARGSDQGNSPPYFQMTNQRPTDDQPLTDKRPANDRPLTEPNRTVSTALYIPTPIPPPPPAKTAVAVESIESDWKAAEAAVREAGVGQWSKVVDDAIANGYTPAELIDDAFVVRHCSKLGPGALRYRVRDRGRCWPESGIPDAETLRANRIDRADAIRASLAAVALREGVATESPAFHARAFEKLRAANLEDLTTDIERRTFDAIRSGQVRPDSPPSPNEAPNPDDQPTRNQPTRRRRSRSTRICGQTSGVDQVVPIAAALSAGRP